MGDKQLAVVEQLPLIRQYFEEIHKEVEEKTKRAMNLVVTEDNIKDIKKIRAELNKEFQVYEEKRKEIKRQILAPYESFDNDYKQFIANAFVEADDNLREKIIESEDVAKKAKKDALKEYFDEMAESLQLTKFIQFEQLPIKVNISDSMNKLMKEVETRLKSIQNDIMLINLEQDKEDIMVEYLVDYNFARAKMEILKRKEIALRIKQEQERIDTVLQQEKERVEELKKEIIVPKVVGPNVETLTTSFKVQGTREQLIALREYINESGLTLLKD